MRPFTRRDLLEKARAIKFKSESARIKQLVKEVKDTNRKFEYLLKHKKWSRKKKKSYERKQEALKNEQKTKNKLILTNIQQRLRLSSNEIQPVLVDSALNRGFRKYSLPIDGSSIYEYLLKARDSIVNLILPNGSNQYNFHIRVKVMLIMFEGKHNTIKET